VSASKSLEDCLSEARMAATQLSRLSTRLSRVGNQVLVDRDELEALRKAKEEIEKVIAMTLATRDYKDVIAQGKTTYNGKKILLPREAWGNLLPLLRQLKGEK